MIQAECRTETMDCQKSSDRTMGDEKTFSSMIEATARVPQNRPLNVSDRLKNQSAISRITISPRRLLVLLNRDALTGTGP